MKTNYEKLAKDFAKKHGIKLSFIGEPRYGKYFHTDQQPRYVFKCKLSREGKSYIFTFGQSLAKNAERPTIYDILACFTKSDPGTFEDFCNEFGYGENSGIDEAIEKDIYEAVVIEWDNVKMLFGDILEELIEIS